MRVIAGEAGGIPLNVPKTLTRPTTDRVREAIFSSLGDRVPGANILDLYAGTGSLGIEALSRGANSVVFIDEYRPACEAIEANLKKTRLEGGTVRRGRVNSFLRSLNRPDRFDLILADPPYARDESTADELAGLLASEPLAESLREEGGVFVLESFGGSPLPDSGPWTIDREKKYGETRVSYLLRSPGQQGLGGE